MNINEKISAEENRHNEKIRELNELIKMYKENAREYSTYVDRNLDQATNFEIDTNRILSYEESRKSINPYEKQIEDIHAKIKEENELHERIVADLMMQKQEMARKQEEEEVAKERERQQKEIELLSLQQEINKIENERLEIEKRIRTISSATLGSFFSSQISEKYPEEYQTFQQYKEQVRNHSNSSAQITDLKEKFNKVSEELQFYKNMLPVYENFYKRFEQMKREIEQQRVDSHEQKRIYNLIYSEENERLKAMKSIYTAWDLSNKAIPSEYQGMTYEQVEALINQKKVEEKARQDAKATRDSLIGKAIRKNLMVPEDYHLSEIQIKNLSQLFADYTNDELQDFINGVKKEDAVVEMAQTSSIEIKQEPAVEIKQEPVNEVKQNPTISYDEKEKSLISYIESKNNNFGKVVEILSVTGYPDSTYEVRFENGEIHNVTITQKEKRNLSSIQQTVNQPQIQPIIQPQDTKESTFTEPVPQEQSNELQEKNQMIDQIIGGMLDAGNFSNTGLDITAKMRDIKYAKSKLQSKTLEELQIILSTYQKQSIQDENMHR